VFSSELSIGTQVNKGDVIAHVDAVEVKATLDGVLRGLLKSGLTVPEGFKIADIDPRGNPEHCQSVSDKGWALGGSVLEVVDAFHAHRIPQ